MIPTLPFPTPADAPIGVFDSGVGGLSVLRHIRALLPQEHLIYFADSGFAPYGDKTEAVVVERSLAVAAFLVARGVKALVVACNTATVAAIKAIRAHHPALPVVGVKPGLKPGAAATRNGKVGVLATQRTLSGEKFLLLREQIAGATQAQFLLQPCVGLVDLIEQGELDTEATRALLERYVAPLVAQGADTLVLGCTHYPFVQEAIARAVAQAGGVDVADRHRRCRGAPAGAPAGERRPAASGQRRPSAAAAWLHHRREGSAGAGFRHATENDGGRGVA